MSRVYDALQQCCPDQVYTSPVQGDNGHSLFVEPIPDLVWEPDTAPIAQANFSSDERLPALFSRSGGFASEQFRLLATRLQQMQQKGALKSILLTSSVAQEGKSLLIVNLAMALAQGAGQKILLVDADLRNSGACRTLRMEERSGIRDWYHSNRPITDFVCRLAGLNVWVLPAGQESVDPLELLKSPRMTKLLSAMCTAFDWVLIDSTPLLPIADAEVLSGIADGTIVAVRRDRSGKAELKQALARVASSKMIGLVLNDFPATGDYGESYGVGKPSEGSRTSPEANRLNTFKAELKQGWARVAPARRIGRLLNDLRATARYVSRTLWESVRTDLEPARKQTRFQSFKTELKQGWARVAPARRIGRVLNELRATARYVSRTLWESARTGLELARKQTRFQSFKTELRQLLARVAPARRIGRVLNELRATARYVSRTLWESVRTSLELARKQTRFKSIKTELKQALARIPSSKMIGLLLSRYAALAHRAESYTVRKRKEGAPASQRAYRS